jgi:hypothetical protein
METSGASMAIIMTLLSIRGTHKTLLYAARNSKGVNLTLEYET